MFNPKAWFIPRFEADPDDYWTGLGVIALIDWLRLTLAPSDAVLFLWIPVLAFLTSLHVNRLRHAMRPLGLAAVAVGVAVIIKTLIAGTGMVLALMPYYLDFLAGQGVDVNDAMAIQEASRDQALMDAFSEWMVQNADMIRGELFQASAWTSMLGFWAVIVGLAFWYAGMRRSG